MRGRPKKTKPGAIAADQPLESSNPPPDMTAQARAVWTDTLERVRAVGGEIPSRYIQVMRSFCEASALAARAASALETEGLTIFDRRGNPTRNPACTILTQAQNQIRAMAESLGLTAASAGRLPTTGGRGGEEPAWKTEWRARNPKTYNAFVKKYGREPDNEFDEFD